MSKVVVAIELTTDGRQSLLEWSRGRSTPQRLVLDRIVFVVAEGQ